MKVIGVVALIVSLAAAAGAVCIVINTGAELTEFNKKIQKLQEQVGALQTAVTKMQEMWQSAPEPASAPQAPVADQQKIAQIDSDLKLVRAKIEDIYEKIEQAKKSADVRLAKIEKGARNTQQGNSGGIDKAQIEELIDSKIKRKAATLGKEPHLNAVAAALELNESEKNSIEVILRAKKNDMMTLLKTSRPDGTNMLDEFADELIEMAVTEGDEGARKCFIKFFQRVSAEKVPGKEETYLGEIIRFQTEAKKELKEVMTDKQFAEFETLPMENPLDIKIAEEPLEVYLQQRAAAAGLGK